MQLSGVFRRHSAKDSAALIFQGWIDLDTGEIDLSYTSAFDNCAFGMGVSAEPLKVVTRNCSRFLQKNRMNNT
jgi:hypothetical protein